MLNDIPIIGRIAPDPSGAQLRALERITAAIKREHPELAADAQFHRLVPQSLVNGSCLHLDDLSEITCFDGGQEFYFMQDRARLRAGDGDVVATLSPSVAGYEEYCRRHLGLGAPKWVHPLSGRHLLRIAEGCWKDFCVRSKLLHLLRSDSLHYIHPHMGTFPVWELGILLQESSGRPLKVIAPPPALARLANNKVAFARIVSQFFGDSCVPLTRSAWNMTALFRVISNLARSARIIALKRPYSAGGDAIEVIAAEPIRRESRQNTYGLLSRLVDRLQWDRTSELLISSWETEVLCSPSAQLWIPTERDGAPIVEGIFRQVLDRGASVFAGAVEAKLSTDLLCEIATRSWLLARLFQKLGYVGRCSFDCLLVGESLNRSRLEFIECNGRWGGTSLPMSLMNRIFGDYRVKPYAVRTLRLAGLNQIPFEQLCESLKPALYDHRTGAGRLILITPGLIHHHSAITVLALGESPQDAMAYVENSVPVLLSQTAKSGSNARIHKLAHCQ